MIFALKNIAIDIFFNFIFWMECFVKILIPGLSVFLLFSWSFTIFPNYFVEIARKITKDDDFRTNRAWVSFLPKILIFAFTFGDFFGRFMATSRLCVRAKRNQLIILVIVRFLLSLGVFALFCLKVCGTFFVGLSIFLFATIHGYVATRSFVLTQQTLIYHQMKRGGIVISG